jgi:predicted transcriptional regulator
MSIDRERIRRMSAAGYTNREIARELGCSHTRVAQVIAEDGRPVVTVDRLDARKDGTFVLKTTDPQIVGVIIRRALAKAGVTLPDSDAGQSSGPPPSKASNRNREA